jgi:hypothetical protein
VQNNSCRLAAFALVLSVLAGCGAPTTTEKVTVAPKPPALTFGVASLNLSSFEKRMEKRDIDRFSSLLKSEQIDILSVQGITRYPGLSSRVDFVKELAATSDMRCTFGEMYNASGKQDGNAIFSIFPQRNNHSDTFDGVQSADFEAALQSSVDGGVKDIVVVSTVLPPKASEADQAACLGIIEKKSLAQPGQPIILTGNLPSSKKILGKEPYRIAVDSANASNNVKENTRIWFSNDGSLKLMNTRTVETAFGPMVVARFGLY